MTSQSENSGVFPNDFIWGVSTSSYQIEGAWNTGGKGKSIWDDFTHEEGHVEDSLTGDDACDSYNQMERDVEMLRELGVSSYRFSFSWPRIMPDGKRSNVSESALQYYNKLIDLLLANDIKPMATLYHWDLPSALQSIGGWTNEDIVDIFADYADFCYSTFGDRIKMWITINEPQIISFLGYCIGLHAPGEKDLLKKPYQVSRTLLLAHAHAWHIYNNKYRKQQCGLVSLALNSDWGEPSEEGNGQANREAAEKYMQFTLGWFADPVYLHGDYPQIMKNLLELKQKEEGDERCRLPNFSEEEKKIIKGKTFVAEVHSGLFQPFSIILMWMDRYPLPMNAKGTGDFFALNYYTSRYISPVDEENQCHVIHPDLNVASIPDDTWEKAGSSWLYIVPWGLRKLLNYVSKRYNGIPIIITENGCSTKHAPDASINDTLQLDDLQRVNYITSHVKEMLKAHLHDGVKLQGCYVWSLMDNFEWNAGYTERFGLYHVDFSSKNKTRTPRKSAETYKNIIKRNGI